VTERRFLGLVEVDSGTLLIGDPAYALPHAVRGKPGVDYEATIPIDPDPAVPIQGLPVLLIARFGGDGTFPVYGELDEYGELTSVTVEFVGPDD
jgi:hypothetical protein